MKPTPTEKKVVLRDEEFEKEGELTDEELDRVVGGATEVQDKFADAREEKMKAGGN